MGSGQWTVDGGGLKRWVDGVVVVEEGCVPWRVFPVGGMVGWHARHQMKGMVRGVDGMMGW